MPRAVGPLTDSATAGISSSGADLDEIDQLNEQVTWLFHEASPHVHGVDDTRDLATTYQLGYDPRTAIYSIPPWGISAQTLTSGVLYLARVYPQRELTVNRLVSLLDYATISGLTLAKMGLYLGQGTGSVLAASTSNGSSSLTGSGVKSWEPVLATPNGLYRAMPLEVGMLFVGASPSVYGAASPVPATVPGIRTSLQLTGQSDLPAAFARKDLASSPVNLFLGAAE